jgi:alkanesulfonate monooxygenase SsuD/methylene tetrahydromethanopterin reductase-like flavin-dependent oxidoreductase (luciferase family)
MMTSCVVADDADDLKQRLAEFRQLSSSDAPEIGGTVEEVVARLREYESAGVERVMLQHVVHEDVAMVNVLGKVAAQLG